MSIEQYGGRPRLLVYVAAPFERRELVRKVEKDLFCHWMDSTASWAKLEHEGLPPTELAAQQIKQNDDDIAISHALLVLAEPGLGGEMFAEVARALLFGIPIVWVGRRILSTFRPGVIESPSVEEAINLLESWSNLVTSDRAKTRQTLWGITLEAAQARKPA